MGSPLSGILADIYMNDFENKFLFNIKNPFLKNIIAYNRYVDDTAVIFNGTTRQIDSLVTYISKCNKNIKFTAEHEINNSINFLDLNISKNNNKLKFKIYRKPTTTTTTIHANSYHPYSQKIAAYNSMIHRLIHIPMDITDYTDELNTIKYIAIDNGYNSNIINTLIHKHKQKLNNSHNEFKNNKKFVSSIYTNIIPDLLNSTFKKLNIILP